MAKRGHSNADVKKVRPWHEVDKQVEHGIARIPIMGGASPSSCHELPPLALRREEWEEIGRQMGWHP